MRPGGGVVGGRCAHRASRPACLANGAGFLAARPDDGVIGGRCVHRASLPARLANGAGFLAARPDGGGSAGAPSDIRCGAVRPAASVVADERAAAAPLSADRLPPAGVLREQKTNMGTCVRRPGDVAETTRRHQGDVSIVHMHQCTCGAFVRVHGTGILGSRARYRVHRRVGLRGWPTARPRTKREHTVVAGGLEEGSRRRMGPAAVVFI